MERAGLETRDTADLEVCATAVCRVSQRLGSLPAPKPGDMPKWIERRPEFKRPVAVGQSSLPRIPVRDSASVLPVPLRIRFAMTAKNENMRLCWTEPNYGANWMVQPIKNSIGWLQVA